MSEEFLKHALGVIGTVLYVARALPSTLQALRTRRVDRGSVVGLDLLTVSGIWWVIYALEIDNYPTLISSLAGLIPAILTLLILWRARELHGRGIALLLAGLALVPVALASSRVAAVVAALLNALIAVPESISLVRDPERAEEDASFTMWALVGVNAIVWIAYGIMIEHPIIGAAGVIQLPCAIFICWRLARRGSPAGPAPKPATRA